MRLAAALDSDFGHEHALGGAVTQRDFAAIGEDPNDRYGRLSRMRRGVR